MNYKVSPVSKDIERSIQSSDFNVQIAFLKHFLYDYVPVIAWHSAVLSCKISARCICLSSPSLILSKIFKDREYTELSVQQCLSSVYFFLATLELN